MSNKNSSEEKDLSENSENDEKCFICAQEKDKCQENHEIDEKTLTFIEKARKIHSFKFGYEHAQYFNLSKKVKIRCLIHGIFEQRPNDHIHNKNKCPVCNGKQRLTTQEFIRRATELYRDTYDYSKVLYKNMYTEVIIICKIHGEFKKLPRYFLRKFGCQRCSHSEITTADYIERATEKHQGKYDYSLAVYEGMRKHITIICEIHGKFDQNAQDHMNGRGCPRCGGINGNVLVKTTEDFIKKARKCHKNLYSYKFTKYINSYTPVVIICKIHGKFEQKPNLHYKHGCPKCRTPHGEKFILDFFETHSYKILLECRIPSYKYRYDFFVPKCSLIIEFDGVQHFTKNKRFHKTKTFEDQLSSDITKTCLALENGYDILRIPYTEIDRIPEILEDILENPRTLFVESSDDEVNKIYKEHQEVYDLFQEMSEL